MGPLRRICLSAGHKNFARQELLASQAGDLFVPKPYAFASFHAPCFCKRADEYSIRNIAGRHRQTKTASLEAVLGFFFGELSIVPTIAKLKRVELMISRAFLQEFFVLAHRFEFPVFEDQNHVGMQNG